MVSADVMEAASDAYSLLMENDRVRVLEVRLAPGQTAKMHNHPSAHVVYVFNNATFRLKFPDGNSQDFALKAGQALFIPAGEHETTNIGRTPGRNLVVEIKG